MMFNRQLTTKLFAADIAGLIHERLNGTAQIAGNSDRQRHTRRNGQTARNQDSGQNAPRIILTRMRRGIIDVSQRTCRIRNRTG